MAATMASDVTDGPVLNLINKRLRALRKKLNRITQIEEAIGQGKSINKEQEDVLRSKPSITAAIDELDKLRQPLSSAVSEEVSLAIQRQQLSSVAHPDKEQRSNSQVDREDEIVEDLVKLVYFGSMFDVKPQSDYTSTMLTRTHERSCCLTYDYVTDDDADLLGERDLDLISKIGGLVISRPLDSKLPHKKALEQCIEHAKLWIQKADQPIDTESSITYALLREKLTKIMGSDYLTKIPEMKGPGEVAAAGNYASFHVPLTVEGSVEDYQHQQEEDAADPEGNGIYNNQSSPTEQNHKGESGVENHEEVQSQRESLVKQQGEEGQNQGETDFKDHQHVGRRPYQNQRGGGGRGGGGRRGYYNSNNGRGGRFGGGRGGGGPYQNGRNQYYDQPGNYYPRNYHSNSRGGRGGTSYSHHGPSVQAANVPPTES